MTDFRVLKPEVERQIDAAAGPLRVFGHRIQKSGDEYTLEINLVAGVTVERVLVLLKALKTLNGSLWPMKKADGLGVTLKLDHCYAEPLLASPEESAGILDEERRRGRLRDSVWREAVAAAKAAGLRPEDLE